MLTKALVAATLVGTVTATGPTTVGFTHTVNWDTHTTGTLNVAIGDKVKFGPWTGTHSLWEMPTANTYTQCKGFSSAKQVAGAKDPAPVTVTKTAYYASKEGCQSKKIQLLAADRIYTNIDLATCGANCNKNVVLGQSVKFTSGTKTIVAVGANVFNGACSVSSGKNVANGQATFGTVGTYYYTVKNKGDCQAGQKAMITVTAQAVATTGTTTDTTTTETGPDCAALDGVCKDAYVCSSNIDTLKTCVTTNCPNSYNDAKIAELATADNCVAAAKSMECTDDETQAYCKLEQEAFDNAMDVLNSGASSLGLGLAGLAWLLA